MNRYQKKGYLGQSRWQLPPTNPDPGCTMREGGYNCNGSPMGGLYYNHLIKALGVTPGEPVVRAPDIAPDDDRRDATSIAARASR